MKSPSPEVAKERDAAYDKIDRFLRNNLDDTDYAEYSAALDTVLASTAAKADAGEWQPIETAPQGREMFVVKAFNVINRFVGTKPYTTDPWCVWQDEPGKFARWPFEFQPTHWHAIAASPKTNGGMGS